MKQLSALGARRHFFRNPRRMRLRPGEDMADSPDMMGAPGFGYMAGRHPPDSMDSYMYLDHPEYVQPDFDPMEYSHNEYNEYSNHSEMVWNQGGFGAYGGYTDETYVM